MTYYILFSNDNKPVCGTWQRAENKENAMMDAEFKLMCHFPGVQYDSVQVTDIKE